MKRASSAAMRRAIARTGIGLAPWRGAANHDEAGRIQTMRDVVNPHAFRLSEVTLDFGVND